MLLSGYDGNAERPETEYGRDFDCFVNGLEAELYFIEMLLNLFLDLLGLFQIYA